MPEIAEGEIATFLRSHGPFEDPPLFSQGDRVGDWAIHAFLGRGGSAEVYRAENETTGLVAALKILYRTDDKTRERFRRETALAAEMQSAAFPRFYGAGRAAGRFYIAEELLEPMPLPRTDAAVARFMLAVAAGVEELHRHGFVHRDIKPRNVMMRPATGESVLIDMGLSKKSDDKTHVRSDTVSVVAGRAVGVGTPGFSAPEQFTGGKIGAAADVHALGMLANACFDGRPPRAWTKIIRRSTSSIPGQRYSSVLEFARAVRRRHACRRIACGIFLAIVAAVAAICLPTEPASPREPVGEKDPTKAAISDRELEGAIGKAILNAVCDMCVEGSEGVKPSASTTGVQGVPDGVVSEGAGSNEVVAAKNLFCLGKTRNEGGVAVTRIDLAGRDISLPGKIRLDGRCRIVVSGPGRLTASIAGVCGARLELREEAALVNLTTTPYPESGMKYVLNGACYLNFKNLDPPPDGNYKNIRVGSSIGSGIPSFRFRGPDSYEEVRAADLMNAQESMKKGIAPFL